TIDTSVTPIKKREAITSTAGEYASSSPATEARPSNQVELRIRPTRPSTAPVQAPILPAMPTRSPRGSGSISASGSGSAMAAAAGNSGAAGTAAAAGSGAVSSGASSAAGACSVVAAGSGSGSGAAAGATSVPPAQAASTSS